MPVCRAKLIQESIHGPSQAGVGVTGGGDRKRGIQNELAGAGLQLGRHGHEHPRDGGGDCALAKDTRISPHRTTTSSVRIVGSPQSGSQYFTCVKGSIVKPASAGKRILDPGDGRRLQLPKALHPDAAAIRRLLAPAQRCDRRKAFYKARGSIRRTRWAALRTGIVFLFLFLILRLVGARVRGGREPFALDVRVVLRRGICRLCGQPYGLRFMSWPLGQGLLASAINGLPVSDANDRAGDRSRAPAGCSRRSLRSSKFLDRGQNDPSRRRWPRRSIITDDKHGHGVARLIFANHDRASARARWVLASRRFGLTAGGCHRPGRFPAATLAQIPNIRLRGQALNADFPLFPAAHPAHPDHAKLGFSLIGLYLEEFPGLQPPTQSLDDRPAAADVPCPGQLGKGQTMGIHSPNADRQKRRDSRILTTVHFGLPQSLGGS